MFVFLGAYCISIDAKMQMGGNDSIEEKEDIEMKLEKDNGGNYFMRMLFLGRIWRFIKNAIADFLEF